MSVSFNTAVNAYNNAAKINIRPSSEDENEGTNDANAINAFSSSLGASIKNGINTISNAENTASKSLMKQADITDVVTAVTSAELTLKTIVEVRDKLIAAHKEITQMPI